LILIILVYVPVLNARPHCIAAEAVAVVPVVTHFIFRGSRRAVDLYFPTLYWFPVLSFANLHYVFQVSNNYYLRTCTNHSLVFYPRFSLFTLVPISSRQRVAGCDLCTFSRNHIIKPLKTYLVHHRSIWPQSSPSFIFYCVYWKMFDWK